MTRSLVPVLADQDAHPGHDADRDPAVVQVPGPANTMIVRSVNRACPGVGQVPPRVLHHLGEIDAEVIDQFTSLSARCSPPGRVRRIQPQHDG
jgi:hypothetical protein